MKFKVRYGANGVHFFDRHSGMNVLCDEIKPEAVLWSRAPRQVSIALTNHCDLQCPFCYAPKSHAQLDRRSIITWLTDLDDHGCLGIGFGGGEPMLHPALPSICEFAADNTRLAVTMTTHGHRLSNSLAKHLYGKVNFFRVSVDSVGPYYQEVRKHSLQELRDKLRLIRSIAPFGINCVINRHTVDGLDALAEFSLNEGAREILLLPQQQTSRTPRPSVEILDRLRSWISKYPGPLPLAINASSAEGLPVVNVESDEDPLAAYTHIDAEGRVKRSSYDSFGIPIGQNGVVETIELLARISHQGER